MKNFLHPEGIFLRLSDSCEETQNNFFIIASLKFYTVLGFYL